MMIRCNFNPKTSYDVRIAKYIIALMALVFTTSFTSAQQLTHNDPYDIKRTNISCFLFMRPLGIGNAGPQLRISHYLAPKCMLVFNGIYGVVTTNEYDCGPEKKSKGFFRGDLEADLHLIDYHKVKNLSFYIPLDAADSSNQGSAYTKVESSTRRILAFMGGVQFFSDRQRITRLREARRGYNTVPIMDMNTGQDVIQTNSNIPTNTFYTNLLLGFKFKAITAGALKFQSGKSYHDVHLETYFSIIVPIAYHFDRDVFNNFVSQTPTHRLHDRRPKPGVRIGLYNRNSIRSNWSFGAEFGVQPTIAPRYWNGTYMHLLLGFSFNAGKVKYEDL